MQRHRTQTNKILINLPEKLLLLNAVLHIVHSTSFLRRFDNYL